MREIEIKIEVLRLFKIMHNENVPFDDRYEALKQYLKIKSV